MTLAVPKKVGRGVKKTGEHFSDFVRAVVRVGYSIGIPMTYVFSRNMQELNSYQDELAKCVGVSAALGTGHALDRGIEKIAGDGQRAKCLKVGGYATGALAVNSVMNGTGASMAKIFMEDGLEEGPSLLELFVANGQDMIARTQDVYANIFSSSDLGDYEQITNYGIATLASLTLARMYGFLEQAGVVKAAGTFTKEIIKTALFPLRMLYHGTVGKGYDEHVERRILKDKEKQIARRMEKIINDKVTQRTSREY